MHDGCKLQTFNEKSGFTFLVNHFTAKQYLWPVNGWNFLINCLVAISLWSQYSISNRRKGFFTSNIFGGIIHNSSLSKGAVESRMASLINRRGYPALLGLVWTHYENSILFSEIYTNSLKWGFTYISFCNFR